MHHCMHAFMRVSRGLRKRCEISWLGFGNTGLIHLRAVDCAEVPRIGWFEQDETDALRYHSYSRTLYEKLPGRS